MSDSKKILVVDDEKTMVDMIRLELEHQGYQVACAFDGEQGIEAAKKENPDLILLDVMMPKIEGYEVCRILKNDENLRSIPIILLTAKGQQRDKDKGTEAGADAYMVKPFESESLIEKVQQLLSTS